MDKKNKNSGKFSTTTNYSHKQENSVQRRLKRPDQVFYSGGGNGASSNSSTGASNVTSPTNNTFNETGPPSTHGRGGDGGGFNIRGSRDKKPPLANTGNAMQLPPNIESMAPRFRRKWLQENNLPLDFFEKLVQINANNTNNPYASSMPPPPISSSSSSSSHNRQSQTMPNKGHASRGGNRNNFYGNTGNSGPNNSVGYGNNGKGRQPSLRSPMRSRSRSSDQRGSRHSSRNSSLERSGGNTRVFSNSNNKQHQDMMYDNQRRHGTRSPDYNRGRGDNNKNYGGKSWSKSNYYGNKSMEQGDRRDIADLPPRGKDSVIFDWSLEVEEEEKRKRNENHYHGRRSNRSHSRSNIDRNQPQSLPPSQSSDFDHFKVPYNAVRSRSRKNSQSSTINSRENSTDRSYSNRFSSSRENSTERFQVQRDPTNWRTPIVKASLDASTDAKIAEMTKQFVDAVDLKRAPPAAGVIVLPNSTQLVKEVERERTSSVNKRLLNGIDSNPVVQRTLFDPKNPETPIIVTQKAQNATSRSVGDALLDYKNFSDTKRKNRSSISEVTTTTTTTPSKPQWYDPSSESYKKVHNSQLIEDLHEIDIDLVKIVDSKELFRMWARYNEIRHNGQQVLIEFLKHDIKFCEIENVEQHCWKMLFYNIIELLRRPLSENIPDDSKNFYKEKLMEIIDPGVKYWEQIIPVLETRYNFKLDEFIGANALTRVYHPLVVTEDKKFVKLALVATQKILIYLGDLARYKELVNESNNFAKAKQWYTKAQQVLPKNGRPYNQLALLSFYSKRKIDAVYFYMRSLMSSNPFQSARESLIALFDETRKKYENSQKRRDEKNRLRLKEKEHRFDGGHLRRENWIHPEGGSRIRRFAPLDPLAGHATESTDEDELSQLDALEVNKRFITSFLHIQGKLITKIGMESFVQCAIQMLREFRALIQNSPIAITCHRLLQLIALNMFAIDCSQLKDTKIAGGARSEVQECAIIIGLLMFGIILERFLTVVQEVVQQSEELNLNSDNSAHSTSNNDTTRKLILPEDAKVMLPAIKVWCDWMIHQQSVWNPPPCFNDYSKITSEPWSKLAALVTLLDNNTFLSSDDFSREQKPDYELVKLHEDFTFAGFTPLLDVKLDPVYVHCSQDMDRAENEVRLQKILDFGKNVLCSCSPAILEKRTLNNGPSEYVCVVQNRTDESSDSEILLECISDEDDDEDSNSSDLLLPSTILLKALTGKKSVVDEIDNSSDSNSTNCNKNKKNDDDDDNNDDNNDETNSNNDSTKNENNNEKTTRTMAETSSATEATIINNNDNNDNGAAEIRRLLRRKDELLRKQRMQEKYNERLQDILRQSTVALCMEVRPRFLVPDTNCFVDHLPLLQAIGNAYPLYQLMIPLVVINELEGLSKGLKPSQINQTSCNQITSIGVVPISATIKGDTSKKNTSSLKGTSRTDKEHALKVAEASKAAMEYLKSKPPAVKLVTTKGHQIKTFIASEDNSSDQKSNDDKILDTALNLCKSNTEQRIGDTRHIVREVVLITNDRNLRVKALSNDLPVRELLDFVKWAGLGS